MNKSDLANHLLEKGLGSTPTESYGIVSIVLDAISQTLEDVDVELDGFGTFIVDREDKIQFFADYDLIDELAGEINLEDSDF